MDTTFDQLVTTDVQSGVIVTRGLPFSSYKSENIPNTSIEESILDLSQRSTTRRKELRNSNPQSIVIDNWKKDLICNYTDDIDEDLNRIFIRNNNDNQLNIQQSLTDQLKNDLKKENSLSDNSYQSQIDLYSSRKKSK